MDALLPPPPLGPPLAVACYHNRVDEVKRLLASGADPLEDSIIDGEKRGGYRPLFISIHFGFAECVEALLAAQPELVDSGATLAVEPNKLPPLMFLLERVRNGPSVGGSFAARWARMVLKRCSSERGEREKRFYGDGKDERRRTAF